MVALTTYAISVRRRLRVVLLLGPCETLLIYPTKIRHLDIKIVCGGAQPPYLSARLDFSVRLAGNPKYAGGPVKNLSLLRLVLDLRPFDKIQGWPTVRQRLAMLC
jgi:hypothetical protein